MENIVIFDLPVKKFVFHITYFLTSKKIVSSNFSVKGDQTKDISKKELEQGQAIQQDILDGYYNNEIKIILLLNACTKILEYDERCRNRGQLALTSSVERFVKETIKAVE